MSKLKESSIFQKNPEDPVILQTIATCLGLMGGFLLTISLLGQFISGSYYNALTAPGLWFIAFACGTWALHVFIDWLKEDNARRKRMNEAIANDPLLNNASIDFVDDDRYADWESYHNDK